MEYLTRCYQKSPSVISRAVGNEIVLVPIQGNTANLEEIFMLNETSGRIWGCIDGKNSVAEIKKMVTDEFNVAPQEAQADIISFIKKLEKEGCVSVANSKKKARKAIKGGKNA
jgi:hypothetical protein